MKRLMNIHFVMSLLLICFLLCTVVYAKDFKLKKFETTFTVTFNKITLEEASKLETLIKKNLKDACTIDVRLDGVDSTEWADDSIGTLDGGGITFTAPNDSLIINDFTEGSGVLTWD